MSTRLFLELRDGIFKFLDFKSLFFKFPIQITDLIAKRYDLISLFRGFLSGNTKVHPETLKISLPIRELLVIHLLHLRE